MHRPSHESYRSTGSGAVSWLAAGVNRRFWCASADTWCVSECGGYDTVSLLLKILIRSVSPLTTRYGIIQCHCLTSHDGSANGMATTNASQKRINHTVDKFPFAADLDFGDKRSRRLTALPHCSDRARAATLLVFH